MAPFRLAWRFIRPVLRGYFRFFHRAQIAGLENYPALDVPAIILANHLSLADGPLLAAFLPGDPTFVVDAEIASRRWVRPLLRFVCVIRIDPRNPLVLRRAVEVVRQRRHLVVFPEGRISRTGGLMKVHAGAGLIAEKAGAPIVIVRIEGTQFSHFSYLKGMLRRRWFPTVAVTILPPALLEVDAGLTGRKRREAATAALLDMMIEPAFAVQNLRRSLFTALLDARGRYGAGMTVLLDPQHRFTYRRVVLAACILGRILAELTQSGEHVGIALPNAAGTALVFMGLQAFGRVAAMLNFSSGTEVMLDASRTAGIKLVISSRRFVESGRQGREVAALSERIRVVWLEDLLTAIGPLKRMRGWADTLRARHLPGCASSPDQPAVVLFTSGTEGPPKAVVLSHRNILANCAQAAAVLDFTSADCAFNPLPMFHAFGLTVGTLLPLLSGVPGYLYPSPLHYRIVPELVYATDATILFGTDTFLTGWARYANPYDFRRVRYLFAGGERVREETRRVYAERFGVRILEGYGATETAPVLSITTPLRNASGTVGRFMPGIAWRLEPVPGLAEGGRLWVRGANVMLGYLRAGRPGVIEPPPGGWYDTGDIVMIDTNGFITIRDRAKRFAKIGGEMVPLAPAEELAAAIWPGAMHAVVAIPDETRGEQLLLATTEPAADMTQLRTAAQQRRIPAIAWPRRIMILPRLPQLGSGKVDYPALLRVIEEESMVPREHPATALEGRGSG